MAVDMPPANNDVPIVKQTGYGPADVRYSDFLKMVNSDKIEKVTFSADGTQLLGVDVDGARLKIEALPNDPSLLTELTNHKVSGFHSPRSLNTWLEHLVGDIPKFSCRRLDFNSDRFRLFYIQSFLRSMSLSCLNKKPVVLENSHRA